MSQKITTGGEALARLINGFSVAEVRTLAIEFDHFEKQDVLYYADAYGNLEMAFVLQRFDQTLPPEVHKGIYREYREGGWDVLEMRDTKNIESTECPVCHTDLYHFGQTGSGFGTMNEHGDPIQIEHIDDRRGWYWYPEADETDDKYMCVHCRDSFDHAGYGSTSARIHLPEGSDYNIGDEISGFTTCNGVIRFDDYYQYDSSLWVPLCDVSNSLNMMEFAVSQTQNVGIARSYLDENDWKEIVPQSFVEESDLYKAPSRYRHAFREIVFEWADSDYKIHPDIEAPYLMIDGKLFTTEGGYDQVYETVAEELRQMELDA